MVMPTIEFNTLPEISCFLFVKISAVCIPRVLKIVSHLFTTSENAGNRSNAFPANVQIQNFTYT